MTKILKMATEIKYRAFVMVTIKQKEFRTWMRVRIISISFKIK